MSEAAPATPVTSTVRRRWYEFIDVVVFCLGLLALLVVCGRNAPVFPYMDDWRYCDFYQGQSYWQFIRGPHNEHNIWVFKALSLPIVELTGWNTRLLVLAGIGVYAIAISFFFLLIRRQTTSPFLRCGAALLLVLPGAYENLTWVWPITYHLCYLFGVAALWALDLAADAKRGTPGGFSDGGFSDSGLSPRGSRNVVLYGVAAGLGVLSLFSVGGGVAYAVGLTAALALAALREVARRGREFWTALGGAALLGASILYYLHISPHPAHHPPVLLPWQNPSLFMRLVVTGFGLGLTFPHHPEISFPAGVVALVVIALGVLAAWLGGGVGPRGVRRRPPLSGEIAIFGALMTALVAPAMIAATRSGFGLGMTVVSRYLEINVVAALPFYWALGRLYERRFVLLKVASVALALAVPVSAARAITPAIAHMERQSALLVNARKCLRENGPVPACFPYVYPFPQYVSGCLKIIHSRWGNWGNLGGDTR
jgi:hypothetical protein